MLDFLKRHWFLLTLTALATAAAAVTIFFPPVAIAALTIGLASSAAYAALGTFAVPAAISTVAVAAAASVYAAGGLLRGAANLLSWAAGKLFGTTKAKTYYEEIVSSSSSDEDVAEHGATATAMQSLRRPRPASLEIEDKEDAHAHDGAELCGAVPQAPRAAAASDARCCGLWHKRASTKPATTAPEAGYAASVSMT